MKIEREINLVLSGGGARGLAHVGVLKALNDHGIYPKAISGTSMGAIIGLFYAAGLSPDDIITYIEKLKLYNLLTSFGKLRKRSLHILYPIIKKATGVNRFEQLNLPLHIAVTNVNYGRGEIISKGDCIHAALASATIPIIFRSYSNNKMNYVDGGLLNNFPIDPFLESNHAIVGCNVNYLGYSEKLNGLMNYVERNIRMALYQNVRIRERYCDYLLEPEKTGEITSFDFKKSRKLFEIGEEFTNDHINELLNAISIKKINSEQRKFLHQILVEDKISDENTF